MMAVFDAGLVDGTMSLQQLFSNHPDNELVQELAQYNNNSVKTFFNLKKNELYNDRESAELDKSRFDCLLLYRCVVLYL